MPAPPRYRVLLVAKFIAQPFALVKARAPARGWRSEHVFDVFTTDSHYWVRNHPRRSQGFGDPELLIEGEEPEGEEPDEAD